jgi:hypothetical protein
VEVVHGVLVDELELCVDVVHGVVVLYPYVIVEYELERDVVSVERVAE